MVSPTPATSESSRERADGRYGDTQVTGAVRNGDFTRDSEARDPKKGMSPRLGGGAQGAKRGRSKWY